MKRTQQGFTLIELMIVVAIVGILAAIAIPAYQDYIARAKVTEALAYAAEAKTSVAEFYATNNTWPSSSAQAGVTTAPGTDYISEMTWNAGNTRIEVTLTNINTAVQGDEIYLTGTLANATAQTISWDCTFSDTTALKYVPSNCR